LPLDESRFHLHAAGAVYDMIYRPVQSPLLARARAAVAARRNGLGMLLYQGARAWNFGPANPRRSGKCAPPWNPTSMENPEAPLRYFDPAVWAAVPFHFWSVVFFVFGTIVGSFLNVCIHRLPRGENLIRPRSHCPQCGYT